jgi:DNA modification methylase
MPETKIICGDVLQTLRRMKSDSVHCVVTSPPYFGLRDYGTAKWEGGDPNCPHRPDDTPEARGIASSTLGGGKNHTGHKQEGFKGTCSRCGAVRNDGQIGLEPSPSEYVAKLVEVFRDVRRVLRQDGTCWLNLGDSYARAPTKGGSGPGGKNEDRWGYGEANKQRVKNPNSKQATNRSADLDDVRNDVSFDGLAQKQLLGIPWRVAFALQEDGWYLRQDIIWHKPNPMPESVRDRCTKAHEYLFLLTKSDKYYFDAQAIAEPSIYAPGKTKEVEREPGYYEGKWSEQGAGGRNDKSFKAIRETRNKRSVWTIAPKPYKEAHFATFPPDLVEPCIAAGTSEHGCCPACGAPHIRKFEKTLQTNDTFKGSTFDKGKTATHQDGRAQEGERYVSVFVGWGQSCKCVPAPPQPSIVMDIFGGAGTTGFVAKNLNRHCVLIELNPEYVKLIEKRLSPT